MADRLWRASHYGKVSEALAVALDMPTRSLAPGTEAAVANALVHFRASGMRDEAVRLERLSIEMVKLRNALRDRDDAAASTARAILAAETREWLLAAPMLSDRAPAARPAV